MSVRFRCALPLALLTALFLLPQLRAEPVSYSREVRPILSRHCFKCHGPDENARKAGLRLDVREDAVGVQGDRAAIVPGDPETSELIYRVFTDDNLDVMPPTRADMALTEGQKETLRRWVSEGAEYEPHWAFTKPERPSLPSVQLPRWVRNPIDRFTLAQMEERGLEPGGEADRTSLARRVYLDLLGYPPTPAETDSFVNDPSSDAYERMVDRLLESAHYGERWARLWMDLARYADTNGYEKDRPRSIWAWRDWVIDAFNADMPFDQFTIEQMAGDMLPDATSSQRVATGFHRNSMINEEGGTDPLEYRYYGVVDRVAVTGTTWLGLTVGCAQCHTHKFDPITQTEYYGLMAFLNNADEPELELIDGAIAEQRREKDAEIDELIGGLAERWPLEQFWWQTPMPVASAESDAVTEVLEDRSVRFAGEAAERDTYRFALETALKEIRAIRIEVLPDPSLPRQGPGRADSGNFVLSEIRASVSGIDSADAPKELTLASARADVEQKDYGAAKAIDGNPGTGWAVDVGGDWHVARRLQVEVDPPIELDGPSRLEVKLLQNHGARHLMGRVRVSVGEPISDSRSEGERRAEAVGRAFEQWLARERERVVGWELLKPVSARSDVPWLRILPDHSVLASGDQTKSDTYEVRYRGDLSGVTALRLEAMADERLPDGGPGRVHYEGPKGEFFLSHLAATADGNAIEFSSASDSYARVHDGRRYSAELAIDDDPQTGWSTAGRQGETQFAVFRLGQAIAEGDELELRMSFERYYAAGLGRFRVWVTRDPRAVEATGHSLETQVLLAKAPDDLTYTETQKLRTAFLLSHPALAEAQNQIRDRRRNLPSPPTTLVLAERPPENPRATHRHHRGEFIQPREQVQPHVPSVLPDLPADAPRDRLGLARWLVSRDNPLTARVMVNRQWAALFGPGLVATVGDFGYQGEWPSHPELLDWLAVQFMEDGWSMKRLHRLMVTSATYRQSSVVDEAQREIDPDNRWLARGPRKRLEAEMVRDSALRVSGLLSKKIGGPSVFPPQPPGITTEGAYGPLQWNVSQGEDRYRRGIYTFAKRTAPYAMFATFDAPSGEACVALRDESNTPLQALTLLNNEVLMEAARELGEWARDTDGEFGMRLDGLFRRCLSRGPGERERELMTEFWNAQRERFAENKEESAAFAGQDEASAEQAAWVALARVLLNLDEFITRG